MTEFLSEIEQVGARRLADLWFPGSTLSPRMTELPEYEAVLRRAVGANADATAALQEIASTAAVMPDLTPERLEQCSAEAVEAAFLVMSCAYYMAKTTRVAIGYPGQERLPVSAATADQLVTEELLAPVLARGATYVPTPDPE
ncbi:hypothetical protein ACFWF3_32760 [Nocardia sp. NPDC060220]|uniref:hypothetical protein n=1 Tax=Nocardia sp. NPDC060220 TaxID=3347076 RepID=UPI003658D1E3